MINSNFFNNLHPISLAILNINQPVNKHSLCTDAYIGTVRSKEVSPNLWTVTLKFVQKESAQLLVAEVQSSSFSGLGLSPEINSNLTNVSSYANNDTNIN